MEPDLQRLGRPILSTAHAAGQALAIGPLVSLAFVGSVVASHAGRRTPFVVALGLLAALALAWTLAQYARRIGGPGVVYEYIGRVYGRAAGVLAALAYVAGALTAFTSFPVLTGVFAAGFAGSRLSADIPWQVFAVAAMATVAGLAYRGARLSAGAQLALTAVAAVPFLCLAAVLLVSGGTTGHDLSAFDPFGADISEIGRGLLFATMLYGGFEAAAALAEEQRDPHRSIPRAMLATVAICGAFYVVMMYAITIGFGDRVASEWPAAGPAALAALADRELGSPAGALVELGVVLDIVVVLLAATNASARVVFALARDGIVWPALARTSRHGTPAAGILVVAVPAAAGIAVAGLALDDPLSLFTMLVIAPTFLLTPVIFALVVGAARLLPVAARARAAPVLVAAAALPAFALYATLDPLPTGDARAGIWIGLGLVLAVAGAFLLVRARRPQALARATQHALVAGEPADATAP